ncbi:MAG: efflux RND transporter periplasmic adaptor subunit [gamma proteobacterium endosymbiont of Lamellibrachia anaximandri]|nr:efflux RND transporter periplasmic adaptor subunit [gamma proteobacterium endosymbiont of Lamellibrachia anaximandri]MBL3616485.1 efflux RND transporter periplasmic adaptor subunit [gamma proteobacterium endosymbiont of Lamellibrachia anaximandri]
MKITPLLLSLAFSPLLHSCGTETAAVAPPEILRPVRALEVEPTVTKATREFPAVVDAARSANLSFRVTGIINEMPVKEGEKVKKGDVIAKLDQTDARIELKSSLASYETAQSNFQRGKKLVGPGHISQSDFDKLNAKFATAEAQLEATRQNLNHTVLRASFDGRLARRFAEIHEEVTPQTQVVTLQDISTLTIQINVPESIMLRTRKGSQVHSYFVHFDAIAEQRFPLKLKEAATSADEENQTYEVTFTMPRVKGYTILPGMSAVVIIETESRAEDIAAVFHVPASSVLEDTEGRYVYVVEALAESDTNPKTNRSGVGVIQRRTVTTGELDARGLLITSGLKRGDHILTAGMSQAQPEMKVRWSPKP